MRILFIYLFIDKPKFGVNYMILSYIKIIVSLSVRFLSLLFIVIESKDKTNIKKK